MTRTLLCAIAKKENHYIAEWVEHHLKLGFTHIVIYDNNDYEDERVEDVLQPYIEDEKVTVISWIGQKGQLTWGTPDRPFKSTQIEAYNHCYYTQCKGFDWVMFLDIDEFLEIENGRKIRQLLDDDLYCCYAYVVFCWKYFDDNGLIRVENGNYSIKRFTHHRDNGVGDLWYNNTLFKTCIRTNLPHILINSAHGITSEGPGFENNKKFNGCTVEGQRLYHDASRLSNPIHRIAWVNHYRYKTIEEFLQKAKRGWPDSFADYSDMNLQEFFRGNDATREKLEYLESAGVIKIDK